MDFASWLQSWLTRHPLKAPRAIDRADYTADVMARLKAEAPVPVRAPWWPWPRLALAMATAAAGALVALTIFRWVQLPATLVDDAAQEAQVLAESSPAESNERWVEETMQLLDQLDEDVSSDSDRNAEEDWLEELQLLDETDLAASS